MYVCVRACVRARVCFIFCMVALAVAIAVDGVLSVCPSVLVQTLVLYYVCMSVYVCYVCISSFRFSYILLLNYIRLA